MGFIFGDRNLPVRIAFYMPFKPLDHPHPSGDLVIGTELFQFLRERGHDIRPVSRLRSRWIYWNALLPGRPLGLPSEMSMSGKNPA